MNYIEKRKMDPGRGGRHSIMQFAILAIAIALWTTPTRALDLGLESGIDFDTELESTINSISIGLSGNSALSAGLNTETGAFDLKLGGEAGAQHLIEVTSDFEEWETVGVAKIENGAKLISDLNASARADGFYRVALSILAPPKDIEANTGDTVNFHADAQGASGLDFQWMLNGEALADGPNVEGSSTATLTLKNVTAESQGAVEVVVSNGNDAELRSSATLALDGELGLPVVVESPQNKVVEAGANVEFDVEVESDSELSFQWRHNGVALSDNAEISGATSANLMVSNVDVEDSGQFDVMVTNESGTSVSAGGNLIVKASGELPEVPAIVESPSDATVKAEGTAMFEVTAAGAGELNYQWSLNGEALVDGPNIQGATSSRLIIDNAEVNMSGDIQVEVSNQAGTAVSQTATLDVKAAGQLPEIVDQPDNAMVEAGADAEFSVAAEGTGVLEYQWRLNGNALVDGEGVSGAATANLTIENVNGADSGVIDVVVKNQQGATVSSAASFIVLGDVNVELPLITSQPADASVEAGGDAEFMVEVDSSTDADFQWRLNGEALVDGANVQGATTSHLTLNNVSADMGGQIDVVVSNDSGSQTSAAATLDVLAEVGLEILSQPDDVSVEAGGRAEFMVEVDSSTQADFQWRLNGEALVDGVNVQGSTTSHLTINNVSADMEGQIDVVVSNEAGSQTSAAATLDVLAEVGLEILSQPDDVTVEAGGTAQFRVTVSPLADADFQWRFNGEALVDGPNVNGSTTAHLTIDNVTAEMEGQFDVVVSNDSGSQTSAAAALEVVGEAQVPVIVEQPADQSIQLGGSASFSVEVEGNADVDYQWLRNGFEISNDSRISGTNSATLEISDAQITDAGAYTVRITGEGGFTLSETATLVVSAL